MSASGIEIASAYVTILAKAPGLATSINKALGKVDVGATSKKIGQQLADSVGKSLKDQVAKKLADATAAAFEKQASAAKKLADAEHALVKARAQHGTTNAKVAAAEEKLDQLRKSGKASAADLEKAEAALEKAQADHIGTGRAVASAQNSVSEAKRNAADASKAYTDALSKEQSKAEQALAWMPLANQRIDELANKWKNAGAKISGVGDYLTSHITKPVTIATGAVGSLVGALGFKRLVGIDTARGQFQGLGMDADAVMKQVDAGVTNTSLSMAQGASLAVGILATGSVPLQGLEAQIKRVSNVSAAYNVDAEHAAYLLNNILTKNKVTWGDLSQMQQNQIPIVTQLADYYGVAGDEIMAMAQNGEISVEDLNKVLDQNAGAAAEAYAGTWRGVTSNILANLGRIGAKFLEPTFNIMKEEAAGFLDMLKTDEFSTFAADIGDRIGAIIRQVSEGIRTLIGWWNGLSDGQKKFIGIATGVVVALGPVLKLVGGLFTGIGGLISVGKVVVALFTGWKVAAGGAAIGTAALTGKTAAQTGAMTVSAIAQKAWTKATKLAALAQVGLRKALDLVSKHPIIAAITLIVGALIWFFTQTEVGKKIFAEFMNFLGEAWANVSQFFKTVWEQYLKPVFEAIGAVATWVWENILKPIFDAFAFGFAILAGILQGIWDFILKPIFDAIGAVFSWLWDTIIKVIIDFIVAYVKVWAAIFTWLWENVLSPIFATLGKIFNWIYNVIIKPIIDAIVIYVKIWAAIFTWLWKNAIKPVIDAVAGAFRWLYENVIKPVWDWIQQTISNVWNNKIKPIIDVLVKVIKNDPKKAFEAARDGIGKAWEGIQELAKKPVRFVVETVINGMIGTLNKIPGVKIPKVALPKGFAGGGVIPGYDGVKRDTVLTPMRKGEGVLVPEVVRALGPGFVHSLNAVGNTGGVAAVKARYGAGLAKGGLVHPMPGAVVTTEFGGYPGHRGIDLAKPAGTPIRAAASGAVSFSGWYGGGGNAVFLQHGGGLETRYKHMISSPPVKVGQFVKQKQVIGYEGSTGDSTGPHLHYETMKNGVWLNPRQFLNGSGDAGLFDIIGGLSKTIMKQFTDKFPGSEMFVSAAGGILKQGVDSVIEWAKAKLSIGGGISSSLYDSGGWLNPGMNLVENRSGRPEPVLTGAQWDQLLESRGSGLQPGARLRLVVDGREFDAYVDDRASDVVDDKFSSASPGSVTSRFGGRRR